MSEREFSLEKLKRGFAAAPCGVGVFAIGTRDPLFLNDAYYRMTDYTSQEYAQLIANEDRKLLFSLDLPIIEQAEQRYRDDGTLSGAQYRVVQKNGGVCWVDLTMVSIRADERDCALCFFENITAQKENFTHMKLVTDSIGSGICVMRVKDGTESLLYVNDAFFSLMGIDRKAYLQNAHAFDDVFTSQEDKKRTRDAIRESIRTGTPQELTYRFFRPGSGTVWMEQKLFSVSQDEAGTHLIASVVGMLQTKSRRSLRVRWSSAVTGWLLMK
ncbi:MAG: PAS domain-containing protein [Eubacteriales bacterium]|nr:PAS domain-containing protein [Eubacteriales bacterium]